MNEKEFVVWLKGFCEGAHHFNISPKQWDLLKEKLAEVKEKSDNTYHLSEDWTTSFSYPVI